MEKGNLIISIDGVDYEVYSDKYETLQIEGMIIVIKSLIVNECLLDTNLNRIRDEHDMSPEEFAELLPHGVELRKLRRDYRTFEYF